MSITTADLRTGSTVVIPDANSKGLWLPLTAEHPGEVRTVAGVRPWLLEARGGQQARNHKGEALHVVEFADGSMMAVTLDREWTVLQTAYLPTRVDALQVGDRVTHDTAKMVRTVSDLLNDGKVTTVEFAEGDAWSMSNESILFVVR